MQEDEEHIIEDEPLKVLDIFPKRQTQNVELTIERLSKLYEHLTCTICRELFKTPVYLKCSHRFCKECIQKYIRTNAKKSCPNCRGELNTKRDLHDDYLTDSFIRFAFQDPRTFSASIQRADQLEIARCKQLDLKRLESQPQIRAKLKEINQQISIVVPPLKRTKTQGQEPKKRGRKPNSQKRLLLDSKSVIGREDSKQMGRKQSRNTQRDLKRSQSQLRQGTPVKGESLSGIRASLEVIGGEVVKSDRKKKKIQFIQIDSNSQPEQDVKQIRKQDFLQDDDKVCSIHHMAEEEPPQKEGPQQKIFSFRDSKEMEVEKQNNVKNEGEGQGDASVSMEVEEKEDLMLAEEDRMDPEPAAETNPEVLKALSVLRDEFGPNFPSKVIELTSFSFYGFIEIKRMPLSLICPDIGPCSLFLNLRTPLASMVSLVGGLLNIKEEGVRVYVLEEGDYKEVSEQIKVYQVIQKYWSDWRGVQLVESTQIIKQYSINYEQRVEVGGRVLFYSVDFSRTSS